MFFTFHFQLFSPFWTFWTQSVQNRFPYVLLFTSYQLPVTSFTMKNMKGMKIIHSQRMNADTPRTFTDSGFPSVPSVSSVVNMFSSFHLRPSASSADHSGVLDILDSHVQNHFSNQLPVTSHQSPVTSYQLPVTSHQLPVTSHQLPVTSHQSPVSP